MKCILRPAALFANKAKQSLFYYIVLHCIVFYDVNLTISPLDWPITAGFQQVFHEDVTYPLFVNN